MQPKKSFNKGDKIEVQKKPTTWYPATVLRSSQNHNNKLYIKYETEQTPSFLLEETVHVDDVRPAPPVELHRYFKVGEKVEAFTFGERKLKGWRKGLVVGILENSVYEVLFDDGYLEVEQWKLRGFRDWVCGQWVPPFCCINDDDKESSEPEEKKVSGLKLKIKLNGKVSEVKFNEGMVVEIKGSDAGFRGSWYTAVIVEPLANGKFLVEYRTLSTEDKTELLKEEVDVFCIRPYPPFTQRIEPFHILERVDAWYNDGWWEGYVSKLMSGCRYTVTFTNGDADMVFEHSTLRPHQDWLDGKWTTPSKVSLTEENLKPNQVNLMRKRNKRVKVPTFRDGMMVEVKRDEEGYQGAWYNAAIVSSFGNDSFLVEYHTLKSNDNSQVLREKIYACNIRPCPPQLSQDDQFRVFDEVDAWYNDGWWVGFVSGVLDDLRYTVRYGSRNEELIFEHNGLRPHQEWIGGKWKVASKKKPKQEKAKLEKLKGRDGGMRAKQEFIRGMKVEVKSDQEGYIGSWYPASIVKHLGGEKYLVEYQTLVTDDGAEPLKEEACWSCIRPSPPLVEKHDEYKPCEEVDAWYNDGWWVGRICEILQEGHKYRVYFSITNEILEFKRCDLRPHQDWIDREWFLAERGLLSMIAKANNQILTNTMVSSKRLSQG